MSVVESLINRVSIASLSAPAPTDEQLSMLFSAASRAADHACLKPYRFLVIQGEGLQQFGRSLRTIRAQQDASLSEQQLQRFENLPLRAPMIVVVIASCQDHPKVPHIEQIITAGAAAQNLINAAYALDIGAYWRTGDIAYNDDVKTLLKLEVQEHIVGFIYLGTPEDKIKTLTDKDKAVKVSHWP